MNLVFSRTGGQMTCKVTITLPSCAEAVFTFKLDLESDTYADLAIGAIRDQLYAHLKAERELEYTDGWREARSKRKAKRTWFSGTWSSK